MLILGITKTTLLDYPGRVATSVFTGGCNFRCPYCHNKDIVLKNKALTLYDENEILSFLKKRKHLLSGVCITGGEPTLHNDLPDFIKRIRTLGYCVKLDTNGTNPNMLENLLKNKLIDYCAMDIKNSPEKYGLTIGLKTETGAYYDTSAVKSSVQMLLSQQEIPYEFRTTVVSEFHDSTDIHTIAKWISGAKAYFLQPYTDSEGVLCKGFHAPSKETLEACIELCKPFIYNVALRGI